MKTERKMKTLRTSHKAFRVILVAVIAVAVIWTLLTFWVEAQGLERRVDFGNTGDSTRVLIVYDPDPIYNLDEQVCYGIAKGLAERNIQGIIATTAATRDIDVKAFECVVICANTYNWAPDKAVVDFIRSCEDLNGKNIIAITVGSGSTEQAREKLEAGIRKAGGNIILSKEWWLMRPNDESKMKEDNVQVAVQQAHDAGISISEKIRLSAF